MVLGVAMSELAVVLGLVSVAVAAVALWLGRRPAPVANAEPDMALRVELERLKVSAEGLVAQREEHRERASAAERERDAARAQAAAMQADLASQAARLRELERRDQERLALEGLLERERATLRQKAERCAALEVALEQERTKSDEKLALHRQLHEQHEERFKGIAAQVLEQNTVKFETTAKAKLTEIADAFKGQVKELESKVEQTHQQDSHDRVKLRTELQQMIATSQRLDQGAANLTRALTGDRRAQGAWGELVLERVLEACGLREGDEYQRQTTFTNDEERRLRPDVVVSLPGRRAVVVDAKVSLTAYQEYVVADDGAAQDALERHVEAVRMHVQRLADKSYWQLNGLQTEDYVLMFMPIESAFAEALKAEPTLFAYAFERRVILVSPATLLATLRTIEHSWRVERQNDHARKIVEQAGKLYDKFVGFTTDLEKVGDALGKAQGAYDQAYSKLTSGPGNLVNQVNKIGQLGVKMKKALPEELVEASADGFLPAATVADNMDVDHDSGERPVAQAE
jgi:DNA recombination protein RmuC